MVDGPTVQLGHSVYKALSNPLRHQILMRTAERPWSPSEIATDVGQSVKKVCEQVDALVNWDPQLLELVEKRSGPKGGIVRFYRAVRRFRLETEDWAQLSPLEQGTQTITITRQLHEEWIASIEAGVFYEDPHHALMRTPLNVDREGMRRLAALLIETQDQFAEIERECVERGSNLFRVITGLVSFPAAPAE